MGINISFFKTPRHRVFHYEPLYYDEKKEHREELMEEIEKEKAQKEGREWKDTHYYAGKHIRGKIRESSEKYHRHAMKDSVSKIIGIVSLVILFILIYYFAQYYTIFIQSLGK